MNKEWVVVTSDKGTVIDMQTVHAPDIDGAKALLQDSVSRGRISKAKHDYYDAATFRRMAVWFCVDCQHETEASSG